MALSLLLIALTIPLGISFHQLMNINTQAGYWFNAPITDFMNNLGTFCLVSVLLLIGGWGLLTNALATFGVHSFASSKEVKIIIVLLILVLMVVMGIVGNYFVQRIDLWSA
jgi:hypothetical protein